MKNINVDLVVDANGLSCPMPIVRVKKGMAQLEAGQVVELQSSDKGSMADIKAWAENTGHQYLGSIQEGEVFKHYLRKDSGNEEVEKKYELVKTNEELTLAIEGKKDIQILDVREEAEYAFGHILNSISLPIGNLEDNLENLDKDKVTYVVCRTGHRSDMAAQILVKKGFNKVFNVVPGMNSWNGPLEKVK